jgi:hypothetical protein
LYGRLSFFLYEILFGGDFVSYDYTYVSNHRKELSITQALREQIYEDIWSEPLYKVAKKYNLSSAPLKRRCQECWDIPVPDADYWPKLYAGRKKIRPKLPMPPAEFAREFVSGYAISFIPLEDIPSAELYTEEPLFVFSERTKKILEEAEKNLSVPFAIIDPTHGYKRLIESEKIEPGSKCYRGLRILFSLSKIVNEFEGRSYAPDANRSGHLFAEYMELCHQHWCYHMDLDPKTGKLSLSFFWSKWGYDYHDETAAYRMIFADKEDLPLEEQVATIFHTLMVESGKKIQEEELERRAAIIRKANAERAKKLKPFIDEENKKVENALKDATAYYDAQKIRAYAAAYYEKNSPLFVSQPRLKEYYEWLQKRADWLDPLIENDYDRFLSPQ